MKTIKCTYISKSNKLFTNGKCYAFAVTEDNKYITKTDRTYDLGLDKDFLLDNFMIFTTKPVYTQEMHEAGELPSVGMECEFETTFFTLKGLNTGTCVVIAYHADRVWLDMGKNESVINLNVIAFKPLTPPVKLVDGKAYQFEYEGSSAVGFAFEGATFVARKDGECQGVNMSDCTNIQPLTVEEK